MPSGIQNTEGGSYLDKLNDLKKKQAQAAAAAALKVKSQLGKTSLPTYGSQLGRTNMPANARIGASAMKPVSPLNSKLGVMTPTGQLGNAGNPYFSKLAQGRSAMGMSPEMSLWLDKFGAGANQFSQGLGNVFSPNSYYIDPAAKRSFGDLMGMSNAEMAAWLGITKPNNSVLAGYEQGSNLSGRDPYMNLIKDPTNADLRPEQVMAYQSPGILPLDAGTGTGGGGGGGYGDYPWEYPVYGGGGGGGGAPSKINEWYQNMVQWNINRPKGG